MFALFVYRQCTCVLHVPNPTDIILVVLVYWHPHEHVFGFDRKKVLCSFHAIHVHNAEKLNLIEHEFIIVRYTIISLKLYEFHVVFGWVNALLEQLM